MSDIVLSVEVRERTGKGGAREARRGGLVPGVLYGGDRGPVAITLKNNELIKAINSGKFLSQMITINHKGETQTVLTRDVQFDPVRDFPLHVDFQRVDENSVISVEVPVRFLNEEKAPGIKRGGVVNVVRHTIEVYCPAGQIPEAIEIDIEHMNIGGLPAHLRSHPARRREADHHRPRLHHCDHARLACGDRRRRWRRGGRRVR